VAQVEPAAVLAPTAQGVVAGDLQAQLHELYEQVNPSVVNIRVRGNLMGGMIPAIPGMPELPGDGQLPNLDQLPEQLRPFLEPFLDQLNAVTPGQPGGPTGPGSTNQETPCCR
jgi:hypothetical protein